MEKKQLVKRALERATKLLNENWGYVYGAKYNDNPMSQSDLDRLRAANSKVYTNAYYLKAITVLKNHYAIDCSGLVCYAYGMNDIGSWQIAELGSTKPETWETINYKATTQEAGDILWREGHVALAIDEVNCIEARGIDYGVVKSVSADRAFKKIIRMKDSSPNKYSKIGWIAEQDGKYWYAYDSDFGSYYHDCIVVIDDIAYYFDSEGYLSEGQIEIVTGSRGELSRGAQVNSINTKQIRFLPTGYKEK